MPRIVVRLSKPLEVASEPTVLMKAQRVLVTLRWTPFVHTCFLYSHPFQAYSILIALFCPIYALPDIPTTFYSPSPDLHVSPTNFQHQRRKYTSHDTILRVLTTATGGWLITFSEQARFEGWERPFIPCFPISRLRATFSGIRSPCYR